MVVAVGLVAALLGDLASSRSDRAAPLFSTSTDTVLVFDDGGAGAFVLDVDTGEQLHVELPGQRPGDQPYRLWRLDTRLLVVGRGTIGAVVPGELAPRQLGEATYFVPGADPDQLWLINHPGGRVGSGTPTWTLIDASGTVLYQTQGDDRLHVVRGVPGGLALQDEDGLLVWHDRATGQTADYLGGAGASIIDVTPDGVLWCDAACRLLRLHDQHAQPLVAFGAASIVDDEPSPRQAHHRVEFLPGAAWMSGDGALLAAVAKIDDATPTHELVVFEVNGEEVHARQRLPDAEIRGGWSLDGRQFFYRASSPDGSELGRYSATDNTFETVPLQRQGANHTLMPLPREIGLELIQTLRVSRER